MDLFQGQLRSALQCGVCGKSSVSFDPFMYLSVPLPEYLESMSGEGGRIGGRGMRAGRKSGQLGVSLEECIGLFCEVETLEGGE